VFPVTADIVNFLLLFNVLCLVQPFTSNGRQNDIAVCGSSLGFAVFGAESSQALCGH
jgi:hypothetical protein